MNKDINIKSNSHWPVIALLSLIIGVVVGVVLPQIFTSPFSNLSTSNNQISSAGFLDVSYLQEVYSKIQQSYIGDIPSKEDLTYGAVKGLVESLGNEYNSFLDPEESAQYLDSRSPDIEGIGVTLKFNTEATEVETVLPGYPAEKAGLKVGDVIIKVDGTDMIGESAANVASKIRGPSGSKVKVQVLRSNGNSGVLDFEIERQKITVENINYYDLGDGNYRISITQFLDDTAEKFNARWDTVVAEVLAKNPKGIVLDLRGNPGGFVYSVRYVAEDFLKSGEIIMQEETKNAVREVYKSRKDGRLLNIPLRVLVNEGSASASEILAAAIQDNNKGEVVGMKTVGKGVEQQVMELKQDNSLLIIVFQKWLTPNGRNVTAEDPINPNTIVEFNAEKYEADGTDSQLEAAVEQL